MTPGEAIALQLEAEQYDLAGLEAELLQTPIPERLHTDTYGGDMGKFVAVDAPLEHGSTWRGERHEIRHYVGGFGAYVAKVYLLGRSQVVYETAGPHALRDATRWCDEH